MRKENLLGITVKKKDDLSEWYTQAIQKAELIEYTKVSGCIVMRPWSYKIWELLQGFFNAEFSRRGVENTSFPSLIPESLLLKEKEHVEGFSPEVAWVTHSGETKLAERLAVRPTSETIMYDAFRKWIRSHRDLPLKINQWCNIIRWEFKHPVPFLRGREFLWQEGHTAFATKQEAEEEVMDILNLYQRAYEELLAVPVVPGKKTPSEKFAGAEYTLSIEAVFPNGKGVQAATTHLLGQNFAKAFDIVFLDKQQKKQHPWQNSWGFSTRSLGIMLATHGDDKGIILPPKVAPLHAVIIPIITDETKKDVLGAARELAKGLAQLFRVKLDDRDAYTPGWKYNYWELKGVPVRIEIGPRDVAAQSVVLARRDTGAKTSVPLRTLQKELQQTLQDIQDNLLASAKNLLASKTVQAKTVADIKRAVENGCVAEGLWDGTAESEQAIKEETGAKILNIPFENQRVSGNSVTGTKAKHRVLFGKSY
ncbi:proline--tRNA ligase [Candidatus Woesearchaeota archaeon]|nr:MAG: proline--tRNA ligase [Candidatus Woesearchaeota archaeon]